MKNEIELVMKEMLAMQADLNKLTCGDDWASTCTKDGSVRRTVYPLAVILEAGELIDSLNWAHWKYVDKEEDLQNVFMEYIDMLHFILSIGIIMGFEDLLDLDIEDDSIVNRDSIITDTTKLIRLTCAITESYEIEGFGTTYAEFFNTYTQRVLKYTGKSFHDIYKLYISKNTLNIFRQKHGYKESTYIKIWDGLEDNVVLEEIVEGIIDSGKELLTHSVIYRMLEERYKEL